MSKYPLSVLIVLFFVCLNAMVWFFFGLCVAIDAIPSLPDQPLLKSGMTVLAFAVAGIMGAIFYFLRKRNRVAFVLALGLFGVSCIVTFTDDVGWIDLLFLLVNIIPILLLIKDRSWYVQPIP